MIDCTQCPLRKRDLFTPVETEELNFIQTLKRQEVSFEPGANIVEEHKKISHLHTLLSGWAFRYKTLDDGRRQILNFLLPGDLIGLQERISDTALHGVQAMTEVVACRFERNTLWKIFAQQPTLGFDLTWLAAHEESHIDDNLLTVGQRRAKERIATFFVQIYKRADQLDMVINDTLEIPITQYHIADALGLSLVHTNKTLRALYREGALQFDRGRLQLLDIQKISELTDAYHRPVKRRPLL